MYLGDSQVSYPDNPYSRGYGPYGEDLKSKDYYASSGYGPKPREEQKKTLDTHKLQKQVWPSEPATRQWWGWIGPDRTRWTMIVVISNKFTNISTW